MNISLLLFSTAISWLLLVILIISFYVWSWFLFSYVSLPQSLFTLLLLHPYTPRFIYPSRFMVSCDVHVHHQEKRGKKERKDQNAKKERKSKHAKRNSIYFLVSFGSLLDLITLPLPIVFCLFCACYFLPFFPFLNHLL